MNNRFVEERDGFDYRLLLFIKKVSGLSFMNIKRLKQGVWLLSTIKDECWVVKEFSSQSKFAVQEAFTRALFDQGFNQTYRFIPKPIMIEDRVFGLIQYIEPATDFVFQYNSDDHIYDALQLLVHFHETTTGIISSLKNASTTISDSLLSCIETFSG